VSNDFSKFFLYFIYNIYTNVSLSNFSDKLLSKQVSHVIHTVTQKTHLIQNMLVSLTI